MPARSRHTSRHGSLFERWDQRISLVFYTLMSGFAIAAFVAAFFNLPTNPDKWWVANTARTTIETGAMETGMCLPFLVWYILDAEFRALMRRFRSARIAQLAIAILLASAIPFLAYGIALLQGPALWNKLIFLFLLGLMAASMALLITALIVGYIERRHLSLN